MGSSADLIFKRLSKYLWVGSVLCNPWMHFGNRGAAVQSMRFWLVVLISIIQIPIQAACAIAQTAGAENYYITLYKYFSYIPALPITVPQGEQAGDVYREPGTLYARRASCFAEAKVDTTDTYLVKIVEVNRSNVAASIDTKRRLVGDAAARAGVKLNDIVSISYATMGRRFENKSCPSKLKPC
jgi:hypothetical protein